MSYLQRSRARGVGSKHWTADCGHFWANGRSLGRVLTSCLSGEGAIKDIPRVSRCGAQHKYIVQTTIMIKKGSTTKGHLWSGASTLVLGQTSHQRTPEYGSPIRLRWRRANVTHTWGTHTFLTALAASLVPGLVDGTILKGTTSNFLWKRFGTCVIMT